MANIGDRVQALSSKLGQSPREGVVTGVSGRLLQVRWSSGEESTIVPAVGSVTIIAKAKAPSGRNGRDRTIAGPRTVRKKAVKVSAPAKSVKGTMSTTKRATKPSKSTESRMSKGSKAAGIRKPTQKRSH